MRTSLWHISWHLCQPKYTLQGPRSFPCILTTLNCNLYIWQLCVYGWHKEWLSSGNLRPSYYMSRTRSNIYAHSFTQVQNVLQLDLSLLVSVCCHTFPHNDLRAERACSPLLECSGASRCLPIKPGVREVNLGQQMQVASEMICVCARRYIH
jgi:hypothetical protein